MPDPHLPVDTSVKVPDHVSRQAAEAAALHARAYGSEQPASAETPVSPSAETPPQPENQAAETPPQPAPVEHAQQPQPEPVQSQPAPQPQLEQTQTPQASDLSAEQWRHRYLSMEGRYKQASQTIGTLQENLSQMGDELTRMHQHLQRLEHRAPAAQPSVPQTPQRLITDEDTKNFDPEMIDMVRRAALETVQPLLQQTEQKVNQVQQRVTQTQVRGVYSQLESAVPDWRAINMSQEFRNWTAKRDIYSGMVRGQLLNQALKAADAPRVIAFFKAFLAEEQATGQATPDVQAQPAGAPARVPAMSLETLATPGRAKPATGEVPNAPADKPIYSRAQVSAFYKALQQGHYAGRDADRLRDEQAIVLAGREGRIR